MTQTADLKKNLYDFSSNFSKEGIMGHDCSYFLFRQYRGISCDYVSIAEAISNGGPLKLSPLVGSSITREIIPSMLGVSFRFNHPVIAELNEINLLVLPLDTIAQVLNSYEELRKEQQQQWGQERKRYEASPEYAKAQAKAKTEAERINTTRQQILGKAPSELTLGDPEKWNECVSANVDAYGKACVDYAALWARMMESKINEGKLLSDIAEECSTLADIEGITGFMYGCAVNILTQCWAHGKELREWHNKKYGKQGEQATADNAVINPAVLTVTI